MKDSYVILTGSKNNAGDFLIKHRAKALFSGLRPDRKIIDMNAWEKLDQEKLATVNQSRALILMGGPALQCNMYPGIYALTDNLDDIHVPVITMGMGWKSLRGDWIDTYHYPLNSSTKVLLDRIAQSGHISSVRDFHTLNVLANHGYKNFLMTGCPAYYRSARPEFAFSPPPAIRRVAFSLGVSFIESRSMERAMKEQILQLREYFRDAAFDVVFHHSLSPDLFLSSHGAKTHHNQRHRTFAEWLKNNNIDYIDISGSAESMIDYYSTADIHIGYRVHAHILMNSLAKPSILIAEDGRGKAVRDVIGGMVLDAFTHYKMSLLHKLMSRLYRQHDRYRSNRHVVSSVINCYEYEKQSCFQRNQSAQQLMACNFSVMKHFIGSLP